MPSGEIATMAALPLSVTFVTEKFWKGIVRLRKKMEYANAAARRKATAVPINFHRTGASGRATGAVVVIEADGIAATAASEIFADEPVCTGA